MTRRRSHRRSRIWLPVAAAYAAGLWLACMAWVAGVRFVMPARGDFMPHGLPPAWLPALAFVPAALGALGFVWGWRWLARSVDKPTAARAHALSFAAGWVFVLLSGVLLPVLAAFRAGAWPALAWCVLGGMMAAAAVNRLRVQPKLKEVT